MLRLVAKSRPSRRPQNVEAEAEAGVMARAEVTLRKEVE